MQLIKSRLARLFCWMAAGAAVAFGLGLLGERHWALDLLSHWRVQYTVLLAGCGIGLLFLRRVRSASLALLGAAGLAVSVWN